MTREFPSNLLGYCAWLLEVTYISCSRSWFRFCSSPWRSQCCNALQIRESFGNDERAKCKPNLPFGVVRARYAAAGTNEREPLVGIQGNFPAVPLRHWEQSTLLQKICRNIHFCSDGSNYQSVKYIKRRRKRVLHYYWIGYILLTEYAICLIPHSSARGKSAIDCGFCFFFETCLSLSERMWMNPCIPSKKLICNWAGRWSITLCNYFCNQLLNSNRITILLLYLLYYYCIIYIYYIITILLLYLL